MKSRTTLRALILLFGFEICYPYKSIPVGLIFQEGDSGAPIALQHALRNAQAIGDASRSKFYIEVLNETADPEDVVQVNMAVCKLLKRGVAAILAPVSPSSCSLLAAYSNELQMPILSPAIPEGQMDVTFNYGIGIRPSTSSALLDMIRVFDWTGIIYIYDDTYDIENLQQMFKRAHGILNLYLVGILRTTSAEEANAYLRKLDATRRSDALHVILDMKATLARDIIVNHVHDVRVRKRNVHFFVKEPTLEQFWLDNAAEFGALNVTGFLAIEPSWPTLKEVEEKWTSFRSLFRDGAKSTHLNLSTYLLHDAALVLFNALLQRGRSWSTYDSQPRDCWQENQPTVFPANEINALMDVMRVSNAKGIISERLKFDVHNRRKDLFLPVVESSDRNYKRLGTWSDTSGFRLERPPEDLPRSSSLVSDEPVIKITTKLSHPYMMQRQEENGTIFTGNDRFVGFCKDIIDIMAENMSFKYQLQLVRDGEDGSYNADTNEWSGMVGEVLRGAADIALADFEITPSRQRVLEFTDPFQLISFSMIMKNPNSILSIESSYFLFSAFTPGVWILILVATLVTCPAFYLLARYTGEPDSLESATGMWGRRFSIVGSVWFVLGSSLFQGTGIYPRSMSSRVLGSAWWFFTMMMAFLYIASLSTQLRLDSLEDSKSPQYMQLQALSLETIIKESIERGWPQIGIIRKSSILRFVKQSSLPIYMDLAKYLKEHRDLVTETIDEGMDRVRTSNGGYMLMVESTVSEYYTRQMPCDTIAIHDDISFMTYGIAVRMKSPMASKLQATLENIANQGMLSHLYRKWWIDSNQCNKPQDRSSRGVITLHSLSGMFYILLGGMLVLTFVAAAQYYFKMKRKNDMRRRLSFEDMNLGQAPLPAPPLELLQPPVVESRQEEESRVIDGWAERSLVPPTSFSADSHPSSRSQRQES